MAKDRPNKKQHYGSPQLEELEPRILFSADLPISSADAEANIAPLVDRRIIDEKETNNTSAVSIEEIPEHVDDTQLIFVEEEPKVAALSASSANTEIASSDSQELVFVDTQVSDYQQLIDDLTTQEADGSRDFEIILISSDENGLDLIGQTLAERQGVNAIHIISHGSTGEVTLGNTNLNFDTLLSNASSISSWGNALDADADLLIYGCNLASTRDGENLVDALGRLTEADVAASDDFTGHASLGGDWELEYQAGNIESSLAVSEEAQSNWEGLLASDILTGSWSGSGPVTSSTSTANTVGVTGSWSTPGNTNITSVGNDTMSSTAYFSNTSVQGANSLSMVVVWDTSPVFGDPASNDAGTLTVTFTFDKEVVNPILHIDRIGGIDNADANGSEWTVTTAGATLSKLAGVGHLEVDSDKFYRTPYDATSGGDANWNTSSGTAAGSVQVNGNYTSLTFDVTGIGGDGTGGDGIEFVWELIANAPHIITNGGNDTAAISIAENTTAVTTVAADDMQLETVSYSISGGSDSSKFSIGSSSGVLTLNSGQNYESPTDSNTDNIYQVIVAATDTNGEADYQTINVTITNVQEAPSGIPTITGTVQEDQTLTADTSGITDHDGLGAFSYQWLRDGGTISGATSSTYTLGDADVGSLISVRVTYTDGYGTAEGPLSSVQTVAVSNINDAPTGTISISGTTTENQTLTASNTLADIDGLGAISYQWKRDGVDISGATSSTYTLTNADVGTTITVSANYTDGYSTAESVLSSGVGAIAGINDTPVNTVPGTQTIDEDVTTSIAGISISDADAGSGNLTTRLQVSNGVLNITLSGSASISSGSNTSGDLTIQGTVADINATLASLTYTGDNNLNGIAADTLTITTNDGGNSGVDPGLTGDGSSEQDSDTVTINLTAVNDAPQLDNSANPVLSNIAEDSTAPSGAVGNLVSTLVDFSSPAGQIDNITDDGSLLGIAVTALDNSNGDWWYSTDNGSTWNTFGAVSNSTARLLSAENNARIYFQPDADFNGTVTNAITFRAWDQSSGSDGGTANATVNGGSSAFSSATDTIDIVITASNDAPVLDNSGSMTLSNIAEDTTNSSGDSVANIVLSAGGDKITDIDTAAVEGIAVIGNDDTNGTWEYSTDGGTVWTGFGSISNTSAVLLDAADKVRFVPNANYNGTAGNITFHAWDKTSGSNGQTGVDVSSNGGNSAFSSATETATLVVTSINDIPTLTNFTTVVDSTLEDTEVEITLTDLKTQGDEADIDGTVDAFVVQSVSTGTLKIGSSAGTATAWAASTNDTIDATHHAYWTPASNANGTLNAFGVLAQDDLGALSVGNVVVQVATTAVGDTPTVTNITTNEDTQSGAIVLDRHASDSTEVSHFKITGITNGTLYQNDGTTVINNGDYISYAQGNAGLKFTPSLNSVLAGSFTVEASENGTSVAAQSGTATSTITVNAVNDVPTATANTVTTNEDTAHTFSISDFTFTDIETDSLVSITITNQSLASGTLKLSGVDVNDGDTITAANIANLVYSPASNANGSPLATFDFKVNDAGLGTIAAQMDIDVTAVNDAPSATNLSAPESYTEEISVNLTDIVVTDVDSNITVTLVLSDDTAGSLNTATSGAVTSTFTGNDTWTASGAVADVNILLAALIFTPSTDYNGNFSISTSVDDGINPAITGTKNITGTAVNDIPTFTTLGNQSVAYESGAHTVASFTTPAAGGGTDESGQTFSYTLSDDNNALFTAGPSIDANGQLTYTVANGQTGTATVTVYVTDSGGTANGGVEDSISQTFDIVVAGNTAPTVTAIANQTINEDAATNSLAFTVADAEAAAGTLTVTASSSDTTLIPNSNLVLADDGSGNWTIVATPTANLNGSATITVTVNDGTTTTDETFDVVVTAVNDEPSLTTLGNQSVAYESGAHTVASFTTPAAGGGTDESGQTFSYTVSNNNNTLFSVQPTIDASGQLTYTVANGQTGTATVTVSVTDSGGTANSGDDTSPDQTFDITVAANTAPTISTIANQTINEDAATNALTFTVNDTQTAAGSLTVTASSSNTSLIPNSNLVLADDGSGNWTIVATPAANLNGSATITVTVNDGTTTTDETFLVTVNAVNDDPSNIGSLPTDLSVIEDTASNIDLSLLNLNDIDAASSSLTLTLTTSTSGDLTATAGAGISMGGTSTALELTGSLADLNAYLNTVSNITYLHATAHNFGNDADSIAIKINDNGFTGSGGGGDISLGSINIDITAINDEQSLDSHVGLTLNEGATATINNTLLASSDVDNTPAQLVYSVTAASSNGQLELTTGVGASISSFTQDDIDNNRLVYVHDGSETTADSFDFTVDDGVGVTSSGTFDIAITLLNENPPVITASQSFSLSELAANGFSLGNAVATDVDTATTLSAWSITGGNADGVFAIDATSGEITVADNALLDFDTTPAYTLSLTVSDGLNTSALETVSISVNDVATAINAAQTFVIAEDAADASVVGTVVTTGDTPKTFAITAGNTGAAFAIDNAGVITVADTSAIDYETATAFTLTVQSSDGTTPVSETVTITITDVNEAGIGGITDTNVGVNAVAENALLGDAVGITAYASDPDGTDTVSYVLSDNAGGLFAIDPVSGVVTVDGALDAETALTHTITVLATSSDTSTHSQSYSIAVTNIDEFDIGVITDTDTVADTVAENALVGDAVGITALASDADATENVSYSLSDNAGGLFSIDPVSGEVSVASPLDYESATSHSITVLATSDDTSTTTQAFTVSVTDVNEFAVSVVSDSDAVINTVLENANVGSYVGITAAAFDSDGSDSVSFALSDNAGGLFSIDPVSGEVSVAGAIDFETAASHSITVLATSTDGSTNSQSFSIAVANLNDNTPLIADQTILIAEDTSNATVISDVNDSMTSSDADRDGNVLSYHITAGNDAGIFSIDVATGEVSVVDASLLDFESTPAYVLTVEASDGLFVDTAQLSIALLNVNEAPVITVPPLQTIDEDHSLTFSLANGNAIGLSDVDAGTLSVDVTLSTDQGTLTLTDTGNITISSTVTAGVLNLSGNLSDLNQALDGLVFTPDGDLNGTAEIAIRVNDRGNSGSGGALISNNVISITINPVNDLPEVQVPAEVIPMLPGEPLNVAETLAGLLELSDVDAENIMEQLVISIPSGSLSITDAGGLVIFEGNNTRELVLEGSLTDLNRALRSMVFTPSPGYVGEIIISINAYDPGGLTIGAPINSHVELICDVAPAPAPSLNSDRGQDQVIDERISYQLLEPPLLQIDGQLENNLYRAPYTEELKLNNSLFKLDGIPPLPSLAELGGQPLTLGYHSTSPDFLDWRVEQMKLVSSWLHNNFDSTISQSEVYILPIAQAGHGISGNQEISLTMKAIEIGALGLSVGTAFWLLRGSSLLTSLILYYPAWRGFDPLPVLYGEEGENEEKTSNDEKSPNKLESILSAEQESPLMTKLSHDPRI